MHKLFTAVAVGAGLALGPAALAQDLPPSVYMASAPAGSLQHTVASPSPKS